MICAPHLNAGVGTCSSKLYGVNPSTKKTEKNLTILVKMEKRYRRYDN
jgi:hypothetical protein